MIGSKGDDYVKDVCMLVMVEPYGKNLYVLVVESLCYVFLFEMRTLLLRKD